MLLLWEPRVDLSRNGLWKCIAEGTRPLSAAGFASPVIWAHTPPCVPANPLPGQGGGHSEADQEWEGGVCELRGGGHGCVGQAAAAALCEGTCSDGRGVAAKPAGQSAERTMAALACACCACAGLPVPHPPPTSSPGIVLAQACLEQRHACCTRSPHAVCVLVRRQD